MRLEELAGEERCASEIGQLREPRLMGNGILVAAAIAVVAVCAAWKHWPAGKLSLMDFMIAICLSNERSAMTTDAADAYAYVLCSPDFTRESRLLAHNQDETRTQRDVHLSRPAAAAESKLRAFAARREFKGLN